MAMPPKPSTIGEFDAFTQAKVTGEAAQPLAAGGFDHCGAGTLPAGGRYGGGELGMAAGGARGTLPSASASSRQTLLYALLDTMHSTEYAGCLIVVALSSDLRAAESLEKRVRSRLANNQARPRMTSARWKGAHRIVRARRCV